MKAYAVPIDYVGQSKKILSEKQNDIFFLRGFFLDKAIDIENKLIYIIAQYCSEDSCAYHHMGYALMRKEISFSTLINVFISSKILTPSDNISQNEITCFEKKLRLILEIRNKFAHWVNINSENIMSIASAHP